MNAPVIAAEAAPTGVCAIFQTRYQFLGKAPLMIIFLSTVST